MGIDLLALDFDGPVNNNRDVFIEGLNGVLQYFGKPQLKDAYEAGRNYRPTLRQFCQERGIDDFAKVRFILDEHYEQSEHRIQPVPGAVDAMRELSKLVPVAIFSSGPVQIVENNVERHGLRKFVAYVFGDVNKGIAFDFERLIAQAGVPRERVLSGGDTTIDIALAHLVGVQSVGVVHTDYGYQDLEFVRAHRPEPTFGIVEHIRELIPIINNSNNHS